MSILLLSLFLAASELVNAQNEFIFPPPGGVDVCVDVPVDTMWSSSASDSPVTLTLWQTAGDDK
jgi:hypothetical protein